MPWHRARYIMEWTEESGKKQEFIYANSLKEAKIKVKERAEEKGLGIMYGLSFDEMKYKY